MLLKLLFHTLIWIQVYCLHSKDWHYELTSTAHKHLLPQLALHFRFHMDGKQVCQSKWSWLSLLTNDLLTLSPILACLTSSEHPLTISFKHFWLSLPSFSSFAKHLQVIVEIPKTETTTFAFLLNPHSPTSLNEAHTPHSSTECSWTYHPFSVLWNPKVSPESYPLLLSSNSFCRLMLSLCLFLATPCSPHCSKHLCIMLAFSSQFHPLLPYHKVSSSIILSLLPPYS